MENCDDSPEVADAARLARDVSKDDCARCSAVQILSATVAAGEISGGDVSLVLRVCADIVARESSTLQNEAMKVLENPIRSRAVTVVKSLGPVRNADFVVGSVGLIYERLRQGKFNSSSEGSFMGWCYTVLRNQWVSDNRRHKTGAMGHIELATPENSRRAQIEHVIDDVRPIQEASLDLRALRECSFDCGDMETIRQWKPRNRFLILTLSDLWTKVPSDEWRQWLDELQIASPFPHGDFRELPYDQERFRVVAEVLQCVAPGANEANVKRQWHRLLPSLAELKCVRILK